MKILLNICFMLGCASLWSETISLKNGVEADAPQVIVDLSESPYSYSIKAIHVRGRIIELADGSCWKIKELGPETKDYYSQLYKSLPFDFVEDLVSEWQPGEKLVFHVVSDKKNILIYNQDRKFLFDVTPFLPPLEPSLTVSEINEEMKEIVLSDGTRWSFVKALKSQEWMEEDPIILAHNEAVGCKGYVLVNVGACVCDSTVEHIHPNRIDVLPIK